METFQPSLLSPNATRLHIRLTELYSLTPLLCLPFYMARKANIRGLPSRYLFKYQRCLQEIGKKQLTDIIYME